MVYSIEKTKKIQSLPQIEMILSYQYKPQIFLRADLTPYDILELLGESETEYKENLRWCLNGIDTVGLFKISNCVYFNDIEFNLPQWYNNCNGKVYFNYSPIELLLKPKKVVDEVEKTEKNF